MGRKRGRSVTASVVAGFAVCLLAVGGLVASATDNAFDHEQRRAEEALAAAAQSQADDLATIATSAEPILADLAADPGLTSFDPGDCARVLGPFASIAASARVVVLDPDARTVCTLPPTTGDGPTDLPAELYAAALGGRPYTLDQLYLDPVGDQPGLVSAVPIAGGDGRVGALVGILYTGTPPLERPPAVDPDTVILALDPARTMVIAATPDAPYRPGDAVDVGDLDVDGVTRIWRETTVEASGWPVLAGLDEDVALAGAREQRRSLLLVGAGILALVVVLAVTLQRRLARPIRRLGSAINASRRGDHDARAPVAGPTEVAEVAAAFNELVDAQHQLEARLRHTARHDLLTGLLNRGAATEELDRLLGDPSAEPLAVLFIDLDRFKLVNDSHGHAVGDQLLITLADRLRSSVPAAWIVTRFGGDEFVILCPHTTDPVPQVEGIGAILRSTMRVGVHELTVGGSIGIALARPGQAADDLIREADTAMYRAKEQGRGGHAVFDDEMRAWTVSRLGTERDLRGAVERGEMEVHYQPVMDLATGRAVGAEALVRWRHPDRGLLAPLTFIPVAEETGQILAIGAWVTEHAARQAVEWRRAGTPVRVAVNVAAAQLIRSDLVTMVAEALSRAGARPGDLSLEVTESAVLSDIEAAVTQLEAVRRLGVHVAIDDFGTGYSSLAYLQRLPADELKVDRSFVSAVGDDPVSTAIVSSIVDLAHAVGLAVVAEGVERPEQLRTLGQLGCDRAQGFYIARPAPAADVRLAGQLVVDSTV